MMKVSRPLIVDRDLLPKPVNKFDDSDARGECFTIPTADSVQRNFSNRSNTLSYFRNTILVARSAPVTPFESHLLVLLVLKSFSPINPEGTPCET